MRVVLDTNGFHCMGKTVETLQNIFFCVPQMKVSHISLGE